MESHRILVMKKHNYDSYGNTINKLRFINETYETKTMTHHLLQTFHNIHL